VMEYTRKVGGAPGPDSLPGAGPERTLAFGAVFLPRPDAQDKGVQDNVRPARCLSSAGRARRSSASPACAQRRHVRDACQRISDNGLVPFCSSTRWTWPRNAPASLAQSVQRIVCGGSDHARGGATGGATPRAVLFDALCTARQVAKMLLIRGLASAAKHRSDDERSVHYEELLEAEQARPGARSSGRAQAALLQALKGCHTLRVTSVRPQHPWRFKNRSRGLAC